MVRETIESALKKAKIERMDEEEMYYGEIEELKGIWATGSSHEECVQNLRQAIEDWVSFSTQTELPITALEDFEIKNIEEAGLVNSSINL